MKVRLQRKFFMGTYCRLQSSPLDSQCLHDDCLQFILGCDMQDSINSVFTEFFLLLGIFSV